MKLYIANCTQQAQDFIYRLPETVAPRMQRIEIGTQIQISGDLSTADIEAIITQHRPYGLVCVDELDRTRPFVGLCYAIDKPVGLPRIELALSHNRSVLLELGKRIRQESAIAVNNQLEDQVPPGTLKNLDMSVVEDTKNAESPLAEGIRVSRTEAPSPTPTPPRRRARSG